MTSVIVFLIIYYVRSEAQFCIIRRYVIKLGHSVLYKDRFLITLSEWAKYSVQFKSIKPINSQLITFGKCGKSHLMKTVFHSVKKPLLR